MPTNLLRTLTVVFVSAAAFAAGCSKDNGSGDDDSSCPAGSKDCPCYGNGMCDGGLQCGVNGKCETADSGGSSGDSSGGSGATGGSGGSAGTGGTAGRGSGGNANGGSGGHAGNTTGGGAGSGGKGTGGSAVGGSAGTGGATTGGGVGAGSGGSAQSGNGGTGGEAGGSTCGDTSSDWQNCGACGRVCDNQGENCNGPCCVAGQCTPAWSECTDETAGFTTCDELCTSAGETCVAEGCSVGTTKLTWMAWGLGATDRCETFGPTNGTSFGGCDVPLMWDGSHTVRRCCCSDTH